MAPCSEGQSNRLRALYDLFAAAWALGPALLWQANLLVARTLPQGFIRSQTLGTVFLVDQGHVHEVAVMTAALVKLGQCWLVRDIVCHAVEQLDRPDAIAETTAELMGMQELSVVTDINNDMVETGHAAAGIRVTGALGSKLSQDAFEALRESASSFLSGMWPFFEGGDKKKEGEQHQQPEGFARGANVEEEEEEEEKAKEKRKEPADKPVAQRGIEGENVQDFLGKLTKVQASGLKQNEDKEKEEEGSSDRGLSKKDK